MVQVIPIRGKRQALVINNIGGNMMVSQELAFNLNVIRFEEKDTETLIRALAKEAHIDLKRLE